ncbi:hypothetical protein ES703_89880 [subsurface metagenome]
MTLRTRRRAFRLPAGESAATRLSRVAALLKDFEDGKQPPKKAVVRALSEYHSLLQSLWLWGLKKNWLWGLKKPK